MKNISKSKISIFTIRLAVNVFGIWLAVQLLGDNYAQGAEGVAPFIIAGLLFSLVNTLVKPIIIILTLPFLLVTFGLFMLIINGIIVYLAFNLSPGLDMTFTHAVVSAIILSLVNYILSGLLEVQYTKKQEGK